MLHRKSHDTNTPLLTRVGQKTRVVYTDEWNLPMFFLNYAAQKQYREKLRFDGEALPDPYTISEDHWVDDVSK